MKQYYSAAYSIDLSQEFADEVKRLRAAETEVVKAREALTNRVRVSDKFRLAREMAATDNYGGSYPHKIEPTIEIQGSNARISYRIETALPEEATEKPLPSILQHLGEKGFNLMMNSNILTKEEKRAHLIQMGFIKPDAKPTESRDPS
jgi:hypothetical protein